MWRNFENWRVQPLAALLLSVGRWCSLGFGLSVQRAWVLGRQPLRVSGPCCRIGSRRSGHAAHRHASSSLGQCVTLNINLLLVDCLQDKDGDWVETGLHIFFGAYPNMMNVFRCKSTFLRCHITVACHSP